MRKKKQKRILVSVAKRISGLMLRGKKNQIHENKKRKKLEKIRKKEFKNEIS